ncbi:hypothetical protein DPX16_19541 [Anabarilius grahami]|uniref:CxC3 like cysteine cluster domain-containing protein n=1 Tax=Anabarilius grahami TaxID=495550 RepID=A0A3N0Y7K6_ANAGA|nr:hypothetical protein DPX16_19541 [Anabarilius grahami]
MERLSNILASCPSAEPQRSSASSWSFRQQKASERWKEARPYHLRCLIAKEAVGHPSCCLCHEPAVIRSRLKVIAPGFSRQAFAKLLEHRTKCGGRSGHINGDALQRSFFEFSYASFEEDQLCCSAPFTCPACTPEMLAVSADGNRKLYRFQRNTSSDDPVFFEGLFMAEDSAVSTFVDTIQKATQGRGTCGDSQWTAARETSRRASKLDEEGMEVAVCRHGFLLKALNMYRGEIFAYPLYLQKELMPAKAKFFAMDVACKYWPYLEKAARVLPALQELTEMKPFLSIMHARAHATKCEEGAGTTAGEEVEQVNSYLSRCALTSKYMSKAAWLDMVTLHAMGWNHKKSLSLHQALSTRYVKTCQRLQDETARLAELKTELHCTDELVSQWLSDVKEWAADETPDTSHATQGTTHRGLPQSIEGLYLSVRQRKQTLYRQNDSSKFRHHLRRKLAEDKKLLLQEIQKYNGLVLDTATNIDVAAVEHSLTGESSVSQIWPWEVHGSANISIKKQLHDQVMLAMRLQEEKSILVLEMAQHCTWLQSLAVVLKNKMAEEGKLNKIAIHLKYEFQMKKNKINIISFSHTTRME